MQDPNQYPLGLSSLQVRFRKVGDRWEITDDPVAMASQAHAPSRAARRRTPAAAEQPARKIKGAEFIQ